LKPAEEAESAELVALRTELKKVPGFIEITGTEEVVTVAYDAGLISVDQLRLKFTDLKHPVK
jgi:peptide methionine sulfoxide reductase MsrA